MGDLREYERSPYDKSSRRFGITLKEIVAQTGQSRTTTVNKLKLIRARCARMEGMT